MPRLFRNGSERLAIALLGTPMRRRAVAGVAVLAYSTLRREGGGSGEGGGSVAVAPPPPRPAERAPAEPPRPVGEVSARRCFTARDRRTFSWVLLAMFAGIAAVGQFGHSSLLTALGIAGALVLIGVIAPELALALFLLTGAIKDAPWMPALPVDLTLASWAAMIIAMLCISLRRGGIPRVPRATLVAVFLIAIVVASIWWSVDPDAGWSKAMKFELLTMSGFAAPLLLVRDRAAMTRLMLALVGSGILIALTSVATGNIESPLTAAGGNEITAGLYPAAGLIAAIGYLALLPRRWWRIAGFLPAIVLLPAAVGAGSRGVLVSGAAALAYVVVRHVKRARHPRVAAALVAVAVIAGVQLSTTLAGGAAAKYERSLLSTNSNQVLGDRAFLYDRGVTLALDHPLLGVGAGGFASSSIIYENQLYPHNIALELADEEGYAAVLILALLIGAAWWVRRRAPGGLRSPEAIVTGALIIFGVVEAFFSFDINGNRLLWFAFGLAFALPQLRPGGAANAELAR